MLRRYIEGALKHLSFAHRKMAFISGPRQCGKTTVGKMLLEDRGCGTYYNWDETEFRRHWTKSPRFILQSERTEKSHRKIPLIVLDEIHKAKNWKQALKGVYDTMDQPSDILVTGSARLSIYRKGSDSLMGRYYHFRLHPFTLAEIGGYPMLPPEQLRARILEDSGCDRKEDQKQLGALLKKVNFISGIIPRLWIRRRDSKILLPHTSSRHVITGQTPERACLNCFTCARKKSRRLIS
jgi:predicted AAA+ superfamily ATPase